ncbi:MAG: hypothetical protein ACKVQW_14145 [Pyrinomonadaceae bacterium]
MLIFITNPTRFLIYGKRVIFTFALRHMNDDGSSRNGTQTVFAEKLRAILAPLYVAATAQPV